MPRHPAHKPRVPVMHLTPNLIVSKRVRTGSGSNRLNVPVAPLSLTEFGVESRVRTRSGSEGVLIGRRSIKIPHLDTGLLLVLIPLLARSKLVTVKNNSPG